MTTLSVSEDTDQAFLREQSRRVLRRVDHLRLLNARHVESRNMIRAILNGGEAAVRAILGPRAQEKYLPMANYIDSGLSRLAQRLGRRPDVKVVSRRDRDFKAERQRARKLQAIVRGYDDNAELELDLPQVARWLPGYGFVVWVIRTMRDQDGHPYPYAELRDPYDCYPGMWGPKQQPKELAIARRVDQEWLKEQYPQYGFDLQFSEGREYFGGLTVASGPGWESQNGSAVVVEYYDSVGTWTLTVDTGTLLEFAPNALRSGPRFVVAKRYSFDQLVGQYEGGYGLMKMIAVVNQLALVATQDGTLAETNVIGDIISGPYKFGRHQVNELAPGSKVERPGQQIAFGAFQEASRLEEQLRVAVNYPKTEDSAPPAGGWVTGQGLRRLDISPENNVAEYQLSIRYALQKLDWKRLEHDEVYFGERRKPLLMNDGGEAVVEHYTPSRDIGGQRRTNRIYGVMATWDDSAKIVGGLQLRADQILDRKTFRENLYGMEDHELVEERIDQERAVDSLFAVLQQRAAEGDPEAEMALAQIALRPKERDEVISKFFTTEEPQLSPEEEAMIAASLGGGSPGEPQSVATVLSRLEAAGGASGGAQTVGRL